MIKLHNSKLNKFTKNSLQQGRSMIEMLGVLTIIGVLSVGGISSYSKAMNNYKSNKSSDQIATIIANIKNIGMRQHSYQGLNFNSANKFHAIPEDMIKENELINPFGGKVYIGSNSTNITNQNRGFYIAYTDLPKIACINIMSKNWNGKKTSLIASPEAISEDTLKDFSPSSAKSCTKTGKTTTCHNIAFPISDLSAACNCSNSTCSIAIYSFK